MRFWRALGLTDPPPDAAVFNDLDVEMLQLVDQMLELGLVEKDVLLQMTRVIGSSVSRIASAQIDAIEARIDEPVLEDGTEPAVVRAQSPAAFDAASPRVRLASPHADRSPPAHGPRGGLVRRDAGDGGLRRSRRVHRTVTTDRRGRARGGRRPVRGDGLRHRRRAWWPRRQDDRRRGDVRRRWRRRRCRDRARRSRRRITTTSRCPMCGSDLRAARGSNAKATCSVRP